MSSASQLGCNAQLESASWFLQQFGTQIYRLGWTTNCFANKCWAKLFEKWSLKLFCNDISFLWSPIPTPDILSQFFSDSSYWGYTFCNPNFSWWWCGLSKLMSLGLLWTANWWEIKVVSFQVSVFGTMFCFALLDLSTSGSKSTLSSALNSVALASQISSFICESFYMS